MQDPVYFVICNTLLDAAEGTRGMLYIKADRKAPDFGDSLVEILSMGAIKYPQTPPPEAVIREWK